MFSREILENSVVPGLTQPLNDEPKRCFFYVLLRKALIFFPLANIPVDTIGDFDLIWE